MLSIDLPIIDSDLACKCQESLQYGEFGHARQKIRNQRNGRDFCRERMAAFKLPRELRIVTESPRNSMWKVQKFKAVEKSSDS